MFHHVFLRDTGHRYAMSLKKAYQTSYASCGENRIRGPAQRHRPTRGRTRGIEKPRVRTRDPSSERKCSKILPSGLLKQNVI